jgi:hypothetical protein
MYFTNSIIFMHRLQSPVIDIKCSLSEFALFRMKVKICLHI